MGKPELGVAVQHCERVLSHAAGWIRITIPNLKYVLLLNVYCFYTLMKLKKGKVNCHELGTTCVCVCHLSYARLCKFDCKTPSSLSAHATHRFWITTRRLRGDGIHSEKCVLRQFYHYVCRPRWYSLLHTPVLWSSLLRLWDYHCECGPLLTVICNSWVFRWSSSSSIQSAECIWYQKDNFSWVLLDWLITLRAKDWKISETVIKWILSLATLTELWFIWCCFLILKRIGQIVLSVPNYYLKWKVIFL